MTKQQALTEKMKTSVIKCKKAIVNFTWGNPVHVNKLTIMVAHDVNVRLSEAKAWIEHLYVNGII